MSHYPPCATCGNEQFVEEEGIPTCTRCGLQQAGGLQIGDEEPEFGTQGKVIRKKVEKEKVKVTRVYRGVQAYRLYLQAWQHILWRQTYALTQGSAKAPPELWTVARDLWTVRLSKLVHRLQDNESVVAGTDTETRVISTDEDTGLEETSVKPGLAPKLWDTVALIYVSALLVRWPITLRKLYHHIRTEEIPFIRAIRHVPVEMSSRMPQEYQHALDTLTVPSPRDLPQAVWRTLKAYTKDFGMAFPSLNWRVVLVDWIQCLGLPIEVYTAVKEVGKLLGCTFKYDVPTVFIEAQVGNARKVSRKGPVAMAEVQLMCLVIIGTKLLFPFSDGSARDPPQGHPHIRLRWTAWLEVHKIYGSTQQDKSAAKIQPGKHIEIRDRDILTMSPQELDSYMDWYQTTFAMSEDVLKTRKTELEKSILDMFPLAEMTPAPFPPEGQNTVQEADELTMKIQNEALTPVTSTEGRGKQPATSDNSDTKDENLQAGSRYPIFPTMDSLSFTSPPKQEGDEVELSSESSAAVYFHERAAELVCLDVDRLLKAVRHMERKLEKWTEQKKREEVFGVE